MKQPNEKGIAHLGLIIIGVFVVATIAFVSWYVWDRNKGDKKADNSNTLQTTEVEAEKERQVSTAKTFDCKEIFSIVYPEDLQAGTTDAGQCLISNVSVNDMPAAGPLPANQLGLFFTIQSTTAKSTDEYIERYIELSQEDNPLFLKTEEQITLDNGSSATLALIYGGHPTKHDFYLFTYLKNGNAITTSFPANSNFKEIALTILKSIE